MIQFYFQKNFKDVTLKFERTIDSDKFKFSSNVTEPDSEHGRPAAYFIVTARALMIREY